MSSPTFYDFEKRVFELYNNKKFHEALDVAVLARQKFPDKPQRTYFWIACLYSLIGESDKAIATLENALDMGVWWSEQMLISEHDLKSLQERSDFKDILQRCEKMKVEVQGKNKVELLLFTPPDSKHPLPLLLTLHGRNGNARDHARNWISATLAKGLALAVPQSSQVFSTDGFCWDDPGIAADEIIKSYNQIQKKIKVEPNKIIAAGFSQGAALAVKIALSGKPISCEGFIAVAPSFRQIDLLIQSLKPFHGRGLKGCLLTGEHDFGRPKTEMLYNELRSRQVKCQLSVEPNLGHDFPKDFDQKLSSAIDYIME